MDTLAEMEDIPSSQDLYRKHLGALLEQLTASHGEWAVHSVQLLKFIVLLTQAGESQDPGLDPDIALVCGTGSCYIAQDGIKPGLLLSCLPVCRDHKNEPLNPGEMFSMVSLENRMYHDFFCSLCSLDTSVLQWNPASPATEAFCRSEKHGFIITLSGVLFLLCFLTFLMPRGTAPFTDPT